MGVRLHNGCYQSRLSAEFAGARALKEFLIALLAEQSRTKLAKESQRSVIRTHRAL
jgi:hypothetical protein